MNTATFTIKIISRSLLLAALLGVLPGFAQTNRDWTNTDQTTPPGATQEWNYNNGANWSGGTLPVDDDYIRLGNTAGVVALLDSSTAITGRFETGNGSKLYIGSSGNLRIGDGGNGDGRMRLGVLGGTGDYVSIAAGGQISWVGGGYVLLGFSSTLDTAGTIISPTYIQINSGSTLNITGGIIEAHRTHGSIVVSGSLNQSGGAVQNTPVLELSTGTYTISGGSIATTGANGLTFRNATATDGGTFHVDGSGATDISLEGMRYIAAADKDNATWKFTLDNGVNHITPVTLTVNGNSGAVLRNGTTLDVGLNGGVLLSGTDKFTLITRPSGTDTAWGTGPGALWTDTSTSTEISVTLAGSGLGSLNASTAGETLGFTAASAGYIDLTGLTGLETSLQLKLHWSESSTADLSDFTALLAAGGLDYWQISSNEIGLNLNPSVSGGSYFAWDLQGIGSDGMLEGITVIPEPSTLVLLGLAGLASLSLMRRRR